jgi:hypothetical protein
MANPRMAANPASAPTVLMKWVTERAKGIVIGFAAV